jgi:hypothetical protein
MTLGADVSPAVGRAQFLGAWRLCFDTGIASGPFVLSGVAAAAGLAPAVGTIGVVALVGAAALHRWVPRTLPER